MSTERMSDEEFQAVGDTPLPSERLPQVQRIYAEARRARQRESDLERELAAAFKAVESKAKHYAAWPETLFDGQSVADELRKLLALLTPTAREAAAATKCIFGHTLVAPGWCAECAAPPKPTDGGET